MFQFITAGSVISTLGDGFHSVALGIWVLQTTHSAKAMSLIFGVNVVVDILFGALAGAVADRNDRRLLMWSMDFVRALFVFGIAAAMLLHAPFAVVLVLSALTGAASQFRRPAATAALSAIVGKENIQQATSISQTLGNGAQIAGPLLGGLVAGALGGWVAIMGDATSFLICGLAVLLAGSFPSPHKARAARTSLMQDIQAGFAAVGKNSFLLALMIIAPLINLFTSAAGLLIAVIAVNVWHVVPGQFGVLEALMPAGLILGSIGLTIYSKRMRARGWWLAGVIVLAGLIFVALAGVNRFYYVIPLLGTVGVCFAISNNLAGTALQIGAPEEVKGRVFGTFFTLNNVATPLAIFASGILADSFGPTTVMVICGIGTSLSALIVLAFRALRTWD